MIATNPTTNPRAAQRQSGEVDEVLVRSRRWWARTRRDPARLVAWLVAQLRGETSAAGRIERLRDAFDAPESARRVLTKIAAQERDHARWVAGLLAARGVDVAIEDRPERYWACTLPGITDFATGCAAGAWAERMRLARIAVIAEDEGADDDIRSVFARILPQERFHARAFAQLAGEEALSATQEAQRLGERALGLRP